MRTGILPVAVVLLAIACHHGRSGSSDGALPVTALRNVHVVDVNRGIVMRDRTLPIAAGKIRDVGPSDMRVPLNATVVDASGLYVIPGLWEMHGHVLSTSVANWPSSSIWRESPPQHKGQ